MVTDGFEMKWLFTKGDEGGTSVEKFNKMVEEAENSPTIAYEEFKKEVDECLERRMEK
jgi:hypothetical protein